MEWIVYIDEQEMNQVAKLVRCKDCKHSKQWECERTKRTKDTLSCELTECAREPDYFCADGELR